MAERLIEKLDRLGAEAGIKQMTPEVYRFALDVRKDVVAEWPTRPWVGLTDEDADDLFVETQRHMIGAGSREFTRIFTRLINAKLKEQNTWP